LVDTINRRRNTAVMTLCVFVTIVWISVVWRYGFDLADEGFYWYGAQRMLHGEIPLRDFMAYDIGRYAWGALFMHLFNNEGIIAARMSAAVFQLLSVAMGVWIVLRTMDARFSILTKASCGVLVTILLNFWVHPYYKSFDYGASIFAIGMLILMATSLSIKSWFGAGAILGVLAIIGRNHGVYGAIAVLILVIVLAIKLADRRILPKIVVAFICGVIVGFSPTFVMAILVNGFADAIIVSVRDLIQSGSTNISLSVPWPWTMAKGNSGWLVFLMRISAGFAFIALIVLPVVALIRVARIPLEKFSSNDRLMLALGCAGVPYAHYAFSRADLTHLSLSIVPALFIVLSFGMHFKRPLIVGVLLLIASTFVLTQEKLYLNQLIFKKQPSTISVDGTTLYVTHFEARRLDAAEYALASVPSAKMHFLALPDGPGLHAIHSVKMPVWEIYALANRSNSFEEMEIRQMAAARPDIILLSDHALDSKEELRYSRMHPLTYKWINQRYHRAPVAPEWAEMWEVYLRNPEAE